MKAFFNKLNKKLDAVLPELIFIVLIVSIIIALIPVIVVKDKTVDFDVTLTGMNEVTIKKEDIAPSLFFSNSGTFYGVNFTEGTDIKHYLYLTDCNGETLQWEVSAETYAFIDYKYDVGDTITVTKHSKGFYHYKIGDMNLLKSKEVPKLKEK